MAESFAFLCVRKFIVAARPPTGITNQSAIEWPISWSHFACSAVAAMPRMGRNIVTAGSTVQSITHNIEAMFDILRSRSFHSSHLLLPPDFFPRLSSSSAEVVAVAEGKKMPIFTLGLPACAQPACAQPPLQGVGRPLLFGERPADGRFASMMTLAFGRTNKLVGAENAREIEGKKHEAKRRKGTNE